MTYSCTPLPAGRVAIAAGVLALVSSGIRAADVVTIHPEKIVGPVNRLVFGQNMLAYQGSRKEYGLWGAGI